MDDITTTFFESLFSPACIVDRKLTIFHANNDFLYMADISEKYLYEGITLNKCIDIDLFLKNPDLFDKILTGEENVKQCKIKGRNSKGLHLSLSMNIIPSSLITSESEFLILIFSDLTAEENIQKKYKKLYEKELKTAHRELEKAHTALNNELEIAKNIQSGLLPKKFPDLTNLNVAGIYIPTKKAGGDMYDIMTTKDNKTAVFIFDVSGHDVPSALIGAMAKMLFTHYIKSGGRPSEIFAAVNSEICKFIKTGHYLTAFLGIIDPSDNTMIYSHAGHVYPIIYHYHTGEATFIPGNSIFIGHAALSDIAKYHDNIISLEWNDKLLLYTDGLTEATNNKGELYGSQRLSEAVVKYSKHDPETFVKKITAENADFRNGAPLQDDLALFCVQIGCSEEILKKSGFSKEDHPEMLIINSHDDIENICSMILRKLDKMGYTNKEIFQAHQSIHEILSNAIQHGNKYNSDKRVFVLYKVLLDNFSISVIDEGDGFNYKNLPERVLPENIKKDYGKGLLIVKKYMDKIKFNKKGNRILIGKHQKPAM